MSEEAPRITERAAQTYPLYAIALPVVRVLAALFLDLRSRAITGRENIPRAGGFIFASNHCSYFDPPILAAASTRHMTYIAKRELFRNAAFSALIQKLGAHPIPRESQARGAITLALELLAAGHGIVMFPEGTRSRTGIMGPLKPGVAMLSVKSGAPIVPAYIRGSFEAWPKGGRPRRHPVSVHIGEPLCPAGLSDSREAYLELTVRLRARLDRLAGG